MKMILTVSMALVAMATNVLAEPGREYAPGQMKKRYGAESAREFAPGQAKKDGGTYMAPQATPQPPLSMPLAPVPGVAPQPIQVVPPSGVQQGQAVNEPTDPRRHKARRRDGSRSRN